MDDHEIPHHFICPISLQIMKDPVTVATGITYDRDSIQRWQSHGQNNTICPVTNQPLPIASDFTPNHNLRRLIEAWCVSVSDESPQVKETSLEMKVLAINLIKKLKLRDTQLESLKSIGSHVVESEQYRVCFKEFGVVRALVKVLVSCYRDSKIVCLKEALNVLYLVRITPDETCVILSEYDRIMSSLTWVLDLDRNDGCDDIDKYTTMKFHAIVLLKDFIHNAKPHVLERLNRDFFKTIVRESKHLGQAGMKEGLHVMLTTCTWPRNCSMMIESGAIFALIEFELGSPEKAITELIMGVLFHLCSSADGRAQFLAHAASIAMITKRIGKVSPKVDERALMIISLISKFSATDGVLQEMARVGTVEKLCMVLQVNGRHSYPRDKAREILKRHSNVWKDSPCLDVTLLTWYPS